MCNAAVALDRAGTCRCVILRNISSLRLPVFLFVFTLSLLPSNVQSQTHKFAVIVGNNLGHYTDRTLRFAEQDARKISTVLQELGGFDPEKVSLLLGSESSQVLKTLRLMEQRVIRLKNKGESVLLLVYYSGHADGDVLELGASSLRLKHLLEFLKHSKADVRLGILDACQSGSIVKGGKVVPEFEINVEDKLNTEGYAVITSSAEDEASQESKEIRGSFFTHYLVSALRGSADRSGDGKITLHEAYNYTYEKTLSRTSTTLYGGQHSKFEYNLKGHGAIVLSDTNISESKIRFDLEDIGRLVLIDKERSQVVAETQVGSGVKATAYVPSGQYSAYLIPVDRNGVQRATFEIARGSDLTLASEDFSPTPTEIVAAKGDIFRDLENSSLRHELATAAVVRLWALEPNKVTYGTSLSYRLVLPTGWAPTAQFSWTSRGDSTGYNDVGAMAGLGHHWDMDRFNLHISFLLGYELMFQKPWSDESGKEHSRGSSTFCYLSTTGIDWKVGALSVGVLLAVGGRLFSESKIDGFAGQEPVFRSALINRLDVQTGLRLGYWL